MKFNIIFLAIGILFLSSCATDTGAYNYKVNTKPYTVSGVTYYPKASADGFSEVGNASWYGPGFHGKKTASGEHYNQNAFTAAHKTLPFGTRLKVTNLDNGASTIVVVNDRGPFKKGRIIDVSYAAAKQLSMVGTGTARVRIKSIGSTNSVNNNISKTTASSSGSSGTFYVQTGAYSSKDNANAAVKKLSDKGYKCRMTSGSGGTYAVQAGPFSSNSAAESARDKLRKSYSGAFIVR